MKSHTEPPKQNIEVVQLNSVRRESLRSMYRRSAQEAIFTFRLNSLFAFSVKRPAAGGGDGDE